MHFWSNVVDTPNAVALDWTYLVFAHVREQVKYVIEMFNCGQRESDSNLGKFDYSIKLYKQN